VYAPISGTVVEINEILTDEPGLVNDSAEGKAWFVKIEMSDPSEVDDLMGEADYKSHCEKESG
jgi:glycine cleavage system H protein